MSAVKEDAAAAVEEEANKQVDKAVDAVKEEAGKAVDKAAGKSG